MMLAGLGGVLIAPLFQLQDIVFTLVVLGSLAAVVLGGLRSIPIAFAGGLLLGVVQNLVAGYSDDILPRLAEPSSAGSSRRCRSSLVIVLLLCRRPRPIAAARVRWPTTSRGPTTARACRRGGGDSRGRSSTVVLIAFSLQWFGVGLAPGRRLRPDRHRPEPRDGDHLPVVRGRHRHGRAW